MAIALDTSAGLTVFSSSPGTVAYTVTGSNPFLAVACFGGDDFTDDVSAMTYNGVSLTKLTGGNGSSLQETYLWYLVNPSTGPNNLVVTFSGNKARVMPASYTGVLGTDGTNVGTQASASSITVSVSNSVSNDWLVGAFGNSVGMSSGGTGTTLRQASTNGLAIGDSNGTVSVGSPSLQATVGSNPEWAAAVLAIKPVGAAPASPSFRSLLGVGK